jgi:hypothetical protein
MYIGSLSAQLQYFILINNAHGVHNLTTSYHALMLACLAFLVCFVLCFGNAFGSLRCAAYSTKVMICSTSKQQIQQQHAHTIAITLNSHSCSSFLNAVCTMCTYTDVHVMSNCCLSYMQSRGKDCLCYCYYCMLALLSLELNTPRHCCPRTRSSLLHKELKFHEAVSYETLHTTDLCHMNCIISRIIAVMAECSGVYTTTLAAAQHIRR